MKIFDTFLTSTKVHLVDQISSEGRTEGLLTFPQLLGAYWLRSPLKWRFFNFCPL